jgi:DNA polymerase-3 subunit epsilon
VPISPEVTALTGITDEMVAGQRIDEAAVSMFVDDAVNRLHHNVLATALANKLARIAWTVLMQARSYEARAN